MQTTLEILTHPLLSPVRHGFFTRKGGASSGLFSGLNCGRRSTDQNDMVLVNRARVADAMGVPQARLATVKQVHSADVVVLDEGSDIEAVRDMTADGLVTTRRDVAIAVLTADCQPILLADARAGVIGACHAGWRGALDGVIEATVAAMRAAGATRIKAVIGPTISQQNYEVGDEFMDAFLTEDPGSSRFFSGGPKGRPMFDLPGFGLMRLRAAGAEAEWSRHCTYADPARFFSYRRATHEGQADYGRLISAIAL
ncbi:MAG: peptidoglycan editing factor PgeF [Paracoccus sp. (in: a-proteobacteria)]|uniref:peptidoglycan editing factor PgeF n=1 Tax=Paracoccus sp. TaxID=267 RepID=UPI00391AD0DD